MGTLKENKTKAYGSQFLQNTELFMECVLLLDVADKSEFTSSSHDCLLLLLYASMEKHFGHGGLALVIVCSLNA